MKKVLSMTKETQTFLLVPWNSLPILAFKIDLLCLKLLRWSLDISLSSSQAAVFLNNNRL